MSHDSEQIQTTILIILMAADPKPLSIEEIREETIDGVTLEEIGDGLNKLFDRGLVQPIGSHPPNPGFLPSAVLTACGHLHLRKIVADAVASMLAEDDEGEDYGDVSDHLKGRKTQ
jgi:hypothetical protein